MNLKENIWHTYSDNIIYIIPAENKYVIFLKKILKFITKCTRLWNEKYLILKQCSSTVFIIGIGIYKFLWGLIKLDF